MMINKYAEINDRILLYNACKGILRVKTAGYTEKRAFPVVQVVGGTIGAGLGGYGGYRVGDAIAKHYNLDPTSWKARGLRWGGATIGGLGGAVVGAVAPTMLLPAAGAGSTAAGATAAGAGNTVGAITNAANLVGAVGTAGSSVVGLSKSLADKNK